MPVLRLSEVQFKLSGVPTGEATYVNETFLLARRTCGFFPEIINICIKTSFFGHFIQLKKIRRTILQENILQRKL
jgi:hypothetical protein